MGVKVANPVRDGLANDLGQRWRNAARAQTIGQVGQKTLGNILTERKVAGIGGDKVAVGDLRGQPLGSNGMVGIQRGMGRLMD